MNPHDRQQRPSNPTYKQETLSPHKCVHMTGTKHHAKLHDKRPVCAAVPSVHMRSTSWKPRSYLQSYESIEFTLLTPCNIMTNPHLDHQGSPGHSSTMVQRRMRITVLPKATGPGIPLQHSTFIWALPSYWIPLLAPACRPACITAS